LFVWQLQHFHHTNVCLYLALICESRTWRMMTKKMWTTCLSIFLVTFFTSRGCESPPGTYTTMTYSDLVGLRLISFKL
jgi:hypothetical protein